MPTDKKSIDWYNKNAEFYAEHVANPALSLYHAYYEKPAMYALLPDIKGKTVISIGCGSGEDAFYLYKNGAKKSVGVDISKNIIRLAKNKYPCCVFETIDMEEIKYKDGEFDFAYSSMAMHYTGKWKKVLEEVYRILKPRSYFLFSCGHPIDSAMEKVSQSKNLSTRKLEIKKHSKGKIEVFGNYLKQRKFEDAINSEKPTDCVVVWHKPIYKMVREIRSAGFLLDNIAEPKPLPELKKIAPDTHARLMKIPKFIIFKLQKP